MAARQWETWSLTLTPGETRTISASTRPEKWTVTSINNYTDTLLVAPGTSIEIGASLEAGDVVVLPGLDNSLTLRSTSIQDIQCLIVASSGVEFSITKAGRPVGAIMYKQGAQVYRTADFSLPVGVATPISWTDELYDTDKCFDIGNPTRLTCHTDGIYLISAAAQVYQSAAAFSQHYFRVNGVYIAQHIINYPATITHAVMLSRVYPLYENDYVEYVITANNISQTLRATTSSPSLAIQRIGSL